MKIAFFTDTYYPQLNGVTISVDNFARELRKKGHSVYIFAPKIKKRKQKKDNDLTNLASINLLTDESPIYIPKLTSYKEYTKMFRMDFDIIHAHGNGVFSLLGYQVARMKHIPFVLTFHTQLTKYTHYILKGRVLTPKMAERVLRIFANLCDGVITPSEKMKRELISYGVKKNIYVIPNFVEQETFAHTKTNYLHEKYNLAPDVPILLSVGRLGLEKNFSFVIDVFNELKKKNDEVHLVIVGNGTEGKHLKQQVQDLKLSQRIHFTGKIDQKYMPSVYKDASIFVFASVSEVHPLVALEACAAGLPLVVAKDSAFVDVVIDGKNGYLLSLEKKQFVEKIQKIINDKKLRKNMGEYSLELIAKNFPPDKLAEMSLDVYNKILAEKPKERHLYRISSVTMLRLRRTAGLLDRLFR